MNEFNNCYINSGLQIIISISQLLEELNKCEYNNEAKLTNLLKDTIHNMLNNKIFDPNKFIDLFCLINEDFIKGEQNCSQTFIRTLINNINDEYIKYNNRKLIYENNQYNPMENKERIEYENFLKVYNIYPESLPKFFFSGMIKTRSYGRCSYCREEFNNYYFESFIDKILYINEKCHYLSEILDINMGICENIKSKCKKCGNYIINDIKEYSKFIKLPKILIFTLQKEKKDINRILIKPEEIIDMKKYIDNSVRLTSTKYILFAINIRFGKNDKEGHQICFIKRGDEKWYEVNDIKTRGVNIKELFNIYNGCIQGFFYKFFE